MTNEEMLASWQGRRKQILESSAIAFNKETLLFADDETVSACRDACIAVIDKKIISLQNQIEEERENAR